MSTKLLEGEEIPASSSGGGDQRWSDSVKEDVDGGDFGGQISFFFCSAASVLLQLFHSLFQYLSLSLCSSFGSYIWRSLSSATTRSSWCRSSPELLHVERVKLPKWDRNLLSLSSTRRLGQPLYAETIAISIKSKSVKVFCCQTREAPVLEGRCIEEVYDALAERIVPTAAAMSNLNLKHIVGLAGPPGAGKSTLASEVVRHVNKLWPQKASALDNQVTTLDVAIVLPMDGYHQYRSQLSQLDAMENPEETHARRGAPWTFNPELLKSLKSLRSQGSIYAPSFDLGVGDPVEDDIFVSTQNKVVIVEGNYLLLDDWVWREISSIFDEKWFIEVDIDKSMQRVLKRHIATGMPSLTLTTCCEFERITEWNVGCVFHFCTKWRIENNDRPNAETIIKSKKNADLLIRSIDF